MARRCAGEQPPLTAEAVRALYDTFTDVRKRLRRGARTTDRGDVVKTLRAYFDAMGAAHVDYSEAGPARYRMFSEWAASAIIPALAAARQETIEAAARTDLEAWHAALMIRIVAGPWPSLRDDDNRIRMPFPWDGDARGAEVAGAARATSVADTLAMSPEPPEKRGQRKAEGETRRLVAGAVSYCVSHGYYATRSSGRTLDCGCSLVAEALVPADVWERYDEERRASAEKSVKDAWHAYWRWVKRRSAERVRAVEIAGVSRASGASRKDG